MGYALKMPQLVYCGNDCEQRLAEYAIKHRKVCVFTDAAVKVTPGAIKMLTVLTGVGVELSILDGLKPEPTCDQAQETIDSFCKTNATLIVAIGGGSVMDIAKLASIAATNEYTVRDLLDNPALGRKIIPTVMIPTTAGTGAEATPNAIVTVPEKSLKVGIVNEAMIPDLVLLDGDMIVGLPLPIAASTGIDALCHAIECYTSKKATPFSNLFAMEALRLIFANLERACLDLTAIEAKNAMLLAAFYGGVAIASSGTTAVHALSYPLGGRYHIPHGVANAIMLMPVMRFNASTCASAFARIHDTVELSPETDEQVTDEQVKVERLLSRMQNMLTKLSIPTSLKTYGVLPDELENLVEAGMAVQRLLQNNPRPVTAEDTRRLYTEVL